MDKNSTKFLIAWAETLGLESFGFKEAKGLEEQLEMAYMFYLKTNYELKKTLIIKRII